MARRRMVRRSYETIKARCLTLDVTTKEVSETEFTYVRVDKRTDILSELKKVYETEVLKLVSILSTDTETIQYGLDEAKFLELATQLTKEESTEEEE